MKKILITKRLTALLWALVLTLMPMSLMADNTPLSVTVTFEVGSFVYEQAGNAFDGKPETKWCGGILTTNNTNAYVQVQLAEKSKLDYYYLYTGNDINYKDDDSQQQRNPKEWKLYAKVNEGDEWTLISHVTDAGLPTTVSTRSNNYKIDAAYQNIEYNYLKFEILQIEKGDIFEVGEICFIKCNHTFGSDDICTECGYEKQQDDDFVNVASASQMYKVLSGNAHAKVRLTQDIYMSDLGEGESGRHTLCSTFSGTLDGNGHTIWAARPEVQHNSTGHYHRQYLFTYSDGATIKNLTFKNFRVQSVDHHNQAIITSQAKNSCVFENITFDHISTYTSYDNAGAVVGDADPYCTFKNITVKNSDFTVNEKKSGAVVGSALLCTFENIKVENCESSARGGESGGVAGSVQHCKFNNVEVLGTFVKTDEDCAGGVVGGSTSSDYTNCIVDDQSCICADGDWSLIEGSNASIGGIVGESFFGSFTNCINSALIAADGDVAGGIVGLCTNGAVFEDCLNTGMIISIGMDEVKDSFYNKYKTKSLTCVTKTYKGKEYVIREYKTVGSYSFFGGITGLSGYNRTNISKCANLGSIYGGDVGNIGGIAGNLERATIKNCLSDFHGGSGTRAICGAIGDNNGGECFIGSCLNMTTYKDFSAYDNNWDGFKSDKKNYSLTTATDAHHTNKTTAAIIESGKICYLLGEAWEQNLGTDAYPTPTGAKGLYHTRKVNNQYGTVCLPFSVQSDDKISYYSLSRKEEDGEGIKLVFTYNEDKILEGTPLLFCSTEAKDADADNPIEICFNNAGEEFTTTPRNKIFDAGFWDLWGTFEQRVFEDDLAKNIYYVSGGEIRNAKKVTIAPYRAWIYGENIETLTANGTNQAKSVRFVIEDEDGTVTALRYDDASLHHDNDTLRYDNDNSKAYNLNGQRVNANHKGIVIKNGKKTLSR